MSTIVSGVYFLLMHFIRNIWDKVNWELH